MSMNIVPQIELSVKPFNNDRSELLALADHALQEYRTAWARFVATGDDAAYIAAVAAWEDRESLLKQVGHDY